MFENIKVVKGSSDLLAPGILPVGGDRVSKFNQMFSESSMIEQGVDPAEASEFFSKFGEERVKKGCTGNLKNMINILLDRKPVRTYQHTDSTSRPSLKPIAQIYSPTVFTYPDVRDDLKEDIDKLSELMRNSNCYSQQLGTSGNGKGTRLSTLLEFFKYLGFKFEDQFVVNNKESDPNKKESLIHIGTYCKDINMFVMGRWVKSNKSGLVSWSSLDTLTAGGGFDIATSLPKYWKTANYFAEGYVACFTGLWWAERMVELGFTSIHKLGYEYESKDHMLDRVMQRSGKPIKGDASWSQNGLARGVIEHDAKWLNDHPEIKSTCLMLSFDADVSIYGETYLRQVGASESIVQEFLAFCTKYSTLRHCNNMEENHTRFLAYRDLQNVSYSEAEKNIENLPRVMDLINDYYTNNPYV